MPSLSVSKNATCCCRAVVHAGAPPSAATDAAWLPSHNRKKSKQISKTGRTNGQFCNNNDCIPAGNQILLTEGQGEQEQERHGGHRRAQGRPTLPGSHGVGQCLLDPVLLVCSALLFLMCVSSLRLCLDVRRCALFIGCGLTARSR